MQIACLKGSEKLRVLLIATNRESKPSYAVPVGVAHLQTALIHNGHEAEILDLCFEPNENFEHVIQSCLERYQPELIGISIRNIDNETYLRYKGNLDDVRTVVKTCRKKSSSPIVLGGSAFSLFPEEILRILDVELGVVGEGEEAIVRIANAIEKKVPMENVPGLVTYKNKVVRSSEPARVKDVKTVYYPQYFNPDPRYFSLKVVGPQPAYGIQSKRGCAFRCTYCPVPSIEGKKFRLRSTKDIVTEMRKMKDSNGINLFFITDSVLNIPKKHAVDLCNEIIDSNLDVRWMSYANPLQFDQELADLFVRAGCGIINFGLDAACPQMLKSLKKDFSVEDIIRATECSKKSGMRTIHSLLFGGPNETVQTIQETLEIMQQVQPHVLLIGFGIRIYPQTDLWKKLDIGDRSSVNMLEPMFYLSSYLDLPACKEVRDLIENFISNNPSVMTRMNFEMDKFSEETANIIKTFSDLKEVVI